eukprot:gene13041-16632_t
MVHEPDAIVAMQDGHITHFGPAARIAPLLPPGTEIRDFGKDVLISAGFVDTHVHFPQTPMIASFGTQLLDWLERYTFPTELKFADRTYTRQVARRFLQETEALGLRLAAGKVLMDCNAPEALRDTAQSAYDDSLALIRKWHGRGRLLYAITPRFACTSSREQLAAAGALWREHPDCLMQTHIAETEAE